MTVSVRISVFYGSEAVIAKLNELSIPYREGRTCISFDVVEGSKEWSEMMNLLHAEENDPDRNKLFYISYLYTAHYTAREINNAKYLFVRSVYDCVYPLNEDEISTCRCFLGAENQSRTGKPGRTHPLYQHCEFSGLAVVTQKPKWKPRRCFAGGCSQLFCNDFAKELIEENGLTGVCFEPVLNKASEPIGDFWRLVPQLVDGFLVPGQHERICKCPVCGADMFERTTGIWTIQIDERKLPHQLDFFRSPSVLLSASGVGQAGIFLSQRAYRVLKKANITQALVFDPIQGISGNTEPCPVSAEK